jgi:hypothetical protein
VSQENVEVVRDSADAFARGDWERFAASRDL